MSRVTRRGRKARALAWASLSAAIVATACDSSEDFFSTGGFGGASAGVFDSGSTEIPVKESVCDFAVEGERCSYFPDICELGPHPNPSCNALLECKSAEWVSAPANQCAEGCPAAFDSQVPGACDVPNKETLRCEYLEGTCGCAPVSRRETDAGEDSGDGGQPSVDAGQTDGGLEGGVVDAGPYEWRCIKRSEGCPRTRPRLGTSCVKPLRCDYGECLFDDGLSVRCYNQFWTQDDSFACGP